MTIREFFEKNPRVAIAFSGGADSSFLLYEAKQYAKEVRAYFVKTVFQPQFELEDAVRLSEKLAVPLSVLQADILRSETVVQNPANRCYHCKREIFGHILRAAREDGFSVLLDGTNASDDAGDRPGMRALEELSVLSPLKLCSLTKADIRRLSREAGLPTWDKPAYACLATRIPTGERITAEKLYAAEAAETYLFSLGLTDFRVRHMGGAAKLQVRAEQLGKVLENREKILGGLKRYYSDVLLDLEVRT